MIGHPTTESAFATFTAPVRREQNEVTRKVPRNQYIVLLFSIGLLPDLPRIFDLLGDSWRVYRFRIQHLPELEDDTAVSALHRGKVRQVLAAAENTVGVLPDHHSPAA